MSDQQTDRPMTTKELWLARCEKNKITANATPSAKGDIAPLTKTNGTAKKSKSKKSKRKALSLDDFKALAKRDK